MHLRNYLCLLHQTKNKIEREKNRYFKDEYFINPKSISYNGQKSQFKWLSKHKGYVLNSLKEGPGHRSSTQVSDDESDLTCLSPACLHPHWLHFQFKFLQAVKAVHQYYNSLYFCRLTDIEHLTHLFPSAILSKSLTLAGWSPLYFCTAVCREKSTSLTGPQLYAYPWVWGGIRPTENQGASKKNWRL